METFKYGELIKYDRVEVVAKTPLTLTPVYRRVHENYLSYDGLIQAFHASVKEFEKAGYVVDYTFTNSAN